MKYEQVDTFSTISMLNDYKSHLNEINKYLNENIIYDFKDNVWNCLSKKNLVECLNKYHLSIDLFIENIDCVIKDINVIQEIKNLSKEVQLLEEENQKLSTLINPSNQLKIIQNDNIIKTYQELIDSKEKYLDKWR